MKKEQKKEKKKTTPFNYREVSKQPQIKSLSLCFLVTSPQPPEEESQRRPVEPEEGLVAADGELVPLADGGHPVPAQGRSEERGERGGGNDEIRGKSVLTTIHTRQPGLSELTFFCIVHFVHLQCRYRSLLRHLKQARDI